MTRGKNVLVALVDEALLEEAEEADEADEAEVAEEEEEAEVALVVADEAEEADEADEADDEALELALAEVAVAEPDRGGNEVGPVPV